MSQLMDNIPKVYIASKLKYASKWRKLRNDIKYINFHARWFDQEQIETNENPSNEDFHIFWLVDEEDVKNSNAVIVYGEKEDKLRGALIEAGIAIAFKKLVILVGDCLDFGSWRHHPMVVEATSIEHAIIMIKRRFR